MILVLSVAFDLLARMIERRTLGWQTAGRQERRLPQAIHAVPAGAPA
jgi:NitT/TauT family transport system permease protein